MRACGGIAVLALAGCELLFPLDGDDGIDPPRAAWTALAAGLDFTCGLDGDGALWCWGRDHVGQLGLGPGTGDVAKPARVGTEHWTHLSAGEASACAIDTGGRLACWGWNASGQLGDGTAENRDEPTGLDNPGPWTVVSAGPQHTCAITTAAELWCWGRNDSGQVAEPASPGHPSPQQRADLWLDVSAGSHHTCAVKADGTLWCWGSNSAFQLGYDGGASAIPIQVGMANTWRAVTAGEEHSCALDVNGAVACWGHNAYGQLGDGKTIARPEAIPLQIGLDHVAIEAGSWHACALHESGDVLCWGYNELGQLGTSDVQLAHLMPVGLGATGQWAAISASAYTTCGATVDGEVECTGANAFGQLGRGTVGNQVSPVEIAVGMGWRDVSAGGSHTCARLAADASVWCWGMAWFGQLADPSFHSRQRPLRSTDPTDVLDAGTDHTCAIVAGGEMRCWGRNYDGELGTGALGGEMPDPTIVTGGQSWVRVAGSHHTCALSITGALWCWGDNTYAQVDGSTFDHGSPQLVDGGPWDDLAVGAVHGCAVLGADDSLWCWGGNSYRQVADEASDAVVGPRRVQGLPALAAVAAGGGHTCAIDSSVDRELWCWGLNDDGQLGDGTTTSRGPPIQIAEPGPWRSVTAGWDHTCAIKEAGDALWCWGQGELGQLGTGESVDSPTPRPILPGTAFESVDAGAFHTCATTRDERLFCWGLNGVGAIGDERAWHDELAAVQR
jgi:alpha-tubulin suppressor-like RCC1 family protein